jgi:hypothetical protein
MTISLGGVVLNDNLYLDGIENSKGIDTYIVRTLGGLIDVRTMPRSGGRTLSLTTVNSNGALQGMFCQTAVDAIKLLEAEGIPVTLTYRNRGNFNVIITGVDFTQFRQNHDVSPTKEYTGSIQLIEV